MHYISPDACRVIVLLVRLAISNPTLPTLWNPPPPFFPPLPSPSFPLSCIPTPHSLTHLTHTPHTFTHTPDLCTESGAWHHHGVYRERWPPIIAQQSRATPGNSQDDVCHIKNGPPKIGSPRNHFVDKYGPSQNLFYSKIWTTPLELILLKNKDRWNLFHCNIWTPLARTICMCPL